jgi:hypothetical protein
VRLIKSLPLIKFVEIPAITDYICAQVSEYGDSEYNDSKSIDMSSFTEEDYERCLAAVNLVCSIKDGSVMSTAEWM